MFGIGCSSSKMNEMQAQLNAMRDAYAVVEFDMEGNIQTANKNFLDLMGYDLEDIRGENYRMFVDTSDVGSDEYEGFWSALKEGAHFSSEWKRVGRSGKTLWVHATYCTIRGTGGKPAKIVEYATDITKLKSATEDSDAMLNALDRSVAIAQFELDGRIIKANSKFLSMMGYGLSEVVGKHHSMFVSGDYKASQDYIDFWRNLNQGDPVTPTFASLAKGGKEIQSQSCYLPIMGSNGKPHKVLSVTLEVSALSASSHSLNEVKSEIVKTLSEITQAMSDVMGQAGSATSAAMETSMNVQSVASAADEMDASVQEISQNMTRTKQAVDMVSQRAMSGNESTERLVGAAQSMSSIVELIQDIAGQINLLALNATIESARAGEAGKGFAVVASEIKNLASQTAQATEQISSEIEAMQSVSGDVVETLSTIKESIDSVNEYVTSVAGAIEQQTAVTREISGNMQTASSGVGNITAIMDMLNAVVGKASGSVQNVEQAVKKISA